MNLTLLVILALLAALAVSIFMIFRYRQMYMMAAKEVEALRQQVAAALSIAPPRVPAPHVPKKGKPKDPATMNDEELFQFLRDGIIREKLFLNPTFGRTDIVNHFQITKNRVSAAFSRGSDHSSVSDFIRVCRLDYARQLMINEPDMSLVEVASSSGFNHATTFSSDFKNYFGLTPSQFREKSMMTNERDD